MATRKKRLHVSLSKPIHFALMRLAELDDVPEATKASQLIERAIALEEDAGLSALAAERFSPKARYVSHDDAWKKK